MYEARYRGRPQSGVLCLTYFKLCACVGAYLLGGLHSGKKVLATILVV
jgi:hypothetical protein